MPMGTRNEKQQKIADFYNTAANVEGRNAQGIAPIQYYLDAVRSIQNMDQLYEMNLIIMAETGAGLMNDVGLTVDFKDNTRYLLTFSGYLPSLTKEMYQDPVIAEAFATYLKKLFIQGGHDEQTAATLASEVFAFEQTLAQSQMSAQDRADIENLYNLYTPGELSQMIPQANVEQMFLDLGYTMPSQVMVTDPGVLQAYGQFYTQENLPLLKKLMEISILGNFGSLLSQDFLQMAQDFENALYGVDGTVDMQQVAKSATYSIMSDYMGELYAQKYFSAEAKQDVEQMIQGFMDVFKTRIKNLDWMSETTKEKAIEKLDAMEMLVGYQDSWESLIDFIPMGGPQDGANFFENVAMVGSLQKYLQTLLQNEEPSRGGWIMPVFEVNAAYNHQANQIIIPAGILQAPLYDVNAPEEQNLGGIGTIIAHEITHAFDNTGAMFDKTGSMNDWWTVEDYEKFKQICDRVVAFYDGAEVAPGIATNGAMTLGENIADIGGLACAIDMASQLEEPDYKTLFESFARVWDQSATKEYMGFVNALDVHSAGKIRVNRSVVHFDEFYETFGITENDGMYVAPAQRIKIW